MADSTNDAGASPRPTPGTGNTPASEQKRAAQPIRAAKTASDNPEDRETAKDSTAENSATPAAEAPFVTEDGAKTDRPAAKQEDIVTPTTGGTGAPFGDEITQGGTEGPPGLVTADTESQLADARAKLEQNYTHSRQLLTEEKLNKMSGPEIRAVATDRGYEDLGLGGRRTIIRRFLAEQNKDDSGDLHELSDVETKDLGNTSRSSKATAVETGPVRDERAGFRDAQGANPLATPDSRAKATPIEQEPVPIRAQPKVVQQDPAETD